MRFGINTLFLIPGKVGGTEIFLRNLIEQLSKHSQEFKEEYYLFTNVENDKLFINLPKNFKKFKCPIKASNRLMRIIWEQLFLPFLCLYYKIALLHSPGYTCPLFAPCKKLTTIFDLNYHFHSEDFTKIQLAVYKFLIPLVAKKTSYILVHSKRTRKELVEVLGIDKNKIFVIYGGFHQRFLDRFPKNKIDDILKEFEVKKPFILSTAVSYPHKNAAALILAYYQLLKRNPKLKHILVFLGFPGRDQRELEKIISKGKIKKRVLFTGWIDHNKVPAFYQAADIFVFPSLYEGFGLPPLEAMASGVPLIASKASCIPEIVGNGGILVDAQNPENISREMERVLNDKRLQAIMIKKGRQRAANFSWDKCVRQTRNLYIQLIKKTNSSPERIKEELG